MKKIIMSGVVGWDITARDIRCQLQECGEEDIEIEISSPGGFVFEGLVIYNAIKNYPGKKTIKLTGLAASMASYIALAGDKVCAEENAVYMIHNAMNSTQGDYREMKKNAEFLEGLSGLLAKAYVNKTGKSMKEIRAMMDEETWLFGKEMCDAGFVDEIIPCKDKKEKASAISESQMVFKNCFNLMKDDEKLKDDYLQAAAFINSEVVMSSEPVNPYPNEHAARIIEPSKFEQDSFRRKNIKKGIDIIIGKLKGESTMTTQAYRFAKDEFTAEEAKKWLKDHDIKYISFEAASGENNIISEKPAGAGINDMEVSMDKLKDLIAKNPALQDEVNALVEAGIKAYKEKSEKACAIISSEVYPQPVKNVALDVVKGTKSLETLDNVVATFDALKEQFKSNAASTETQAQGATPAQSGSVGSADGVPQSEADYQAKLAQDKARMGVK